MSLKLLQTSKLDPLNKAGISADQLCLVSDVFSSAGVIWTGWSSDGEWEVICRVPFLPRGEDPRVGSRFQGQANMYREQTLLSHLPHLFLSASGYMRSGCSVLDAVVVAHKQTWTRKSVTMHWSAECICILSFSYIHFQTNTLRQGHWELCLE